MNTDVTQRRLRRPEYWLALGAVCLVSVFYYGIRAAAVIGLAVVTAVLTDFFCLFLQNKSYKTSDLSNAAAAVVMVLMFPATIPYSIVLLSTVFAVAVGIHVFGSRGDYLFPPAAVGYLFALICWKNEVLSFPSAGTHLTLFGNEDVLLQSSLSSTFNAEGMTQTDMLDLLIGAVYSPLGTGCILLLLAALVILLVRRCVSYWAILGYLFGISILALFSRIPAWHYIVHNMVLFSMLFLIGDTAIMPKGRVSVLWGSALTGALTVFLVSQYGIEYAPVIAVMLTCPVWHALSAAEERIEQRERTVKQESSENTQPDTISADVNAETEADA